MFKLKNSRGIEMTNSKNMKIDEEFCGTLYRSQGNKEEIEI